MRHSFFILLPLRPSVNSFDGTSLQAIIDDHNRIIDGSTLLTINRERSRTVDKNKFRCYHIPMLRRLFKGITELIYPKKCLACKDLLAPAENSGHVCAGCFSKIKFNIPPFCHSCGRHLEDFKTHKSLCPQCLKIKLNFDRAFSPCVYEGVVKELIHEFKYKGKVRLAQPLSALMANFIREYSLPMEYMDHILPMPLSKTRLREREFNQAHHLSSHISAVFE
ncbi:MAG: double zinc ribbon domain-containing protein, partial [Candidatus Omnitrophica bacterium]|nr:double zinc ribbon domain-containing protein [Candidatus Omnitrophota bacterium]